MHAATKESDMLGSNHVAVRMPASRQRASVARRNFRESVSPGNNPLQSALARVGNVANIPTAKELIMKLGKLTMLSATALLAGGMSLAAAQSNMAPSGSSSSQAAKPQGQCWDAASNTIKDKSGVASG